MPILTHGIDIHFRCKNSYENKTSPIVYSAGKLEEEIIEALIRAFQDTDRRIRIEAITSIANITKWTENKSIDVIENLLMLFLDSDKELVVHAENCLLHLCLKYKQFQSEMIRLQKRLPGHSPLADKAGELVERIIENEKKLLTQREIHDYSWDKQSKEEQENDLRTSVPNFKTNIANSRYDSVTFSVTAPRMITCGSSFILDVWAFLPDYRNKMTEQATEAQKGRAIHSRSKAGVPLENETAVNVELSIPDFSIQDEDTINWNGSISNCNFQIRVPSNLAFGNYLGTAKFYVGVAMIAKLNFELEVGTIEKASVDITSYEHKIKSAFASYASVDRDRVLGRIQGMQKVLPDLDVFFDVASLRSGESWEQRLREEIDIRDVFYLFWSQAAKKSEYVEKEWRLALSLKGIDYINPVPLESPKRTPPPRELAKLHFNEWTLAFESNNF